MSKPSAASNSVESRHHSQLFTVRMWREDLGNGRSEWRGQVQHVLSGETCYFRDWETAEMFMVEMAKEHA